MKKIILTICLFFILFAFSGCGDDTTENQENVVVCQKIEDGTNLRVMTITSDKQYWIQKQSEVRAKVEDVVNNGKYNIVSIKTCYSDACLTSAEIKYSIANDCDNRKLQVIFVHSEKVYWIQKQSEVKSRLDNLVNTGKYNIKDVKTIMLKGYLVAAEIYYYDNQNQIKN